MFLNYEQPLYRPPSEANNLILQITIGCKFNQCSFCSMYKDKQYRLKSEDEIEQDIEAARLQWPAASRIFLADGDAFNLPAGMLVKILSWLQQAFPRLTRVSCYATPANILSKSIEELRQLKSNKLSLLYVGVESGNDQILKIISKGASHQSIKRALSLAHDARLKVSATIILGLGGKQFWQSHIADTITLLNQAPVTYLSTLQLYLDSGSQQAFYKRFNNEFEHQSELAILTELKELIRKIAPEKNIIFRSNHASNALALEGTLPKDKDKLVELIELAEGNTKRLRPPQRRGL